MAPSGPPSGLLPRALRWVAVGLVLLTLLFCVAAAATVGPVAATPSTPPADVGQPALALLAVQQAKLTAPDGVWGSYFGYSVAIDGDTAAVGAPGDTVDGNFGQGSVYVFVRSGATWTQQAKLVAADGAEGFDFGLSVAISGSTLVVGSAGNGLTQGAGQGSVYVFTRDGTTWSPQAELEASDNSYGYGFGGSVAISGDTLVVGSDYATVAGNTGQGSAYVFARSGTTWSQQAKLLADDGAGDDRFGSSVAISGDTIVAGARSCMVTGNERQGAAYVFSREGSAWSQQAKLVASDGAGADDFGCSVAMSADTAVIGASNHCADPACGGAAYVFTRSGATWGQQAELVALDGRSADDFGCSVAMSGDAVLVGAEYHGLGPGYGEGSAYIFTRDGTGWSEQAAFAATDGSENDWFGFSVALSGGTAVAGAYFETVGTTDRQGAVYVYALNPSIAAVYPAHSVPAGAVTITGTNFGAAQGLGTVTFGGTSAAVSSWSNTSISCSVPPSLSAGEADAAVTTATGVSNTVSFTVDDALPGQPVISAITPPQALCGATVTVAGSGFGPTQDTSSVTFAGVAAAVSNWTDTAIVCKVPAGLVPGVVDVVVHTALDSNVAGFVVDSPPAKPSISRITPVKGKVGITLTIYGKYFGAKRGTSKVLFGSKAATRYVSWSATKIRVRVPSITKGLKTVRVATAAGKSNGKYFTRL